MAPIEGDVESMTHLITQGLESMKMMTPPIDIPSYLYRNEKVSL